MSKTICEPTHISMDLFKSKIKELEAKHEKQIHAVENKYENQIDEMKSEHKHEIEDTVYRCEYELKDILDHHQSKLIKITKQRDDLKRRDDYHDNSSTPANNTITQQQAKQRRAQNKKSTGKKQGGQKGRRGKTRKPKPTKTVNHNLDKCKKCHSPNIKETYVKTRVIEDTPPPSPPPKAAKHNTSHYECLDCGEKDMTADTGLPKKGNFGVNIVIQIVMNFLFFMPNRKNAEFLSHLGVTISAGAIFNILFMVGNLLADPTDDIKQKIRGCKILHADETSFSLSGKKIWVWVFRDPKTKLTLFVMRPSRGRDVLTEILGECWNGILICDGWPPYRIYQIQRCWAHLLCGLRNLRDKNPDCPDIAIALSQLRKIFKKSKRSVPKEQRQALFNEVTEELRELVERYRDHEIMGKYMEKIERAIPDAFRYVLDPSIPPTNNTAEREIRKFVIHRKIRGAIRSAQTMIWMANLMTCFTTWSNQGLDFKKKLLEYI